MPSRTKAATRPCRHYWETRTGLWGIKKGHTRSHGEQSIGQVGLVGVGARAPFEEGLGCLVGEEVLDGQVDVELVFLFVVHLAGEGVESGEGLSIAASVCCHGLGQLLLQVSRVGAGVALHG